MNDFHSFFVLAAILHGAILQYGGRALFFVFFNMAAAELFLNFYDMEACVLFLKYNVTFKYGGYSRKNLAQR